MKTKEIKTLVQSAGQLEVTFIKNDGSKRVMLCTKQPSMIPAGNEPKGTGAPENDSTVRVFDLEKEAWRSFRVDSVTNIVAMTNDGEVVDVVDSFNA